MIILNEDQAVDYYNSLLHEYKKDENKNNEEILTKLKLIKNFDCDETYPSIFYDAWLEICDKTVLEWLVKKEAEIKENDYVEKPGLYLHGPCGVGKTFALYAIYRSQRLAGEKARLKNVMDLIRLFKQDFSKDPVKNKPSDYQRMMNPDCDDEDKNNFENYLQYEGTLYIDDLGAEKNTEFVEETLYYLINFRYENHLPTFFTSNLSIKELAERSGDRLASRIAGMCDVIELKGKDKRIKE
jgi:DNA replication protein DnaC